LASKYSSVASEATSGISLSSCGLIVAFASATSRLGTATAISSGSSIAQGDSRWMGLGFGVVVGVVGGVAMIM